MSAPTGGGKIQCDLNGIESNKTRQNNYTIQQLSVRQVIERLYTSSTAILVALEELLEKTKDAMGVVDMEERWGMIQGEMADQQRNKQL